MYERTQRSLELVDAQEGGLDGNAEISDMQTQNRDALLAMEQCLSARDEHALNTAQVHIASKTLAAIS